MRPSPSGTSEFDVFLAFGFHAESLLFGAVLASLFTAAAKSIQVKCISDDEDEKAEDSVREIIILPGF